MWGSGGGTGSNSRWSRQFYTNVGRASRDFCRISVDSTMNRTIFPIRWRDVLVLSWVWRVSRQQSSWECFAVVMHICGKLSTGFGCQVWEDISLNSRKDLTIQALIEKLGYRPQVTSNMCIIYVPRIHTWNAVLQQNCVSNILSKHYTVFWECHFGG